MSTKEILIGKPRMYPGKLLKELVLLFSKLEDVKSAYIAQVFIPDSGIPAHPVIGIEMKGNISDIANELEKVIKKNTCPDEYIDILPSNVKGYAEYFATINPFYIRAA